MKRRHLFIAIVVIVGCSNGTSKKIYNNESDSAKSDIKHDFIQTKFDTIPEAYISLSEQIRMDSLEKYDRKKYAQTILKKLAYCNCLYETLKADSLFRVTDGSYQLIATDLVIHSRDVIDSIRYSVKNYVAWINTVENPFNAKNYSLFCLNLYESKFLDSLIRRYDHEIIKGDY